MEISRIVRGIEHKYVEQALIKYQKTSGFLRASTLHINMPYSWLTIILNFTIVFAIVWINMNHVGLANLPFLLLCGTGTKLKLLLNLINPVLKIQLWTFYYFAWVDWWVLPNFVALVVVFPEIVEFLHFVSRVLFCQVFGVECCGDVDVVRRLGADETRDVPHGRGEGRGAPHEIHDGRQQGLGQVLLIHGDGLLLDRGGVGYTLIWQRGISVCSYWH